MAIQRTLASTDLSFDAAADYRLVQAFLVRDAAATEQLAQRLQIVPRFLSGLCRRFGLPLTPDEIADVAQDAVVIALRKLHQIGPDVPLDAWLHRLCSYELSNALRRRRRRTVASLPDDLADPVDSAIARLERREMALMALDSLRPDEAEIVRLHLFEGLTFPEIEARVGQTLNAVKGRFYRSIELLTTKMRRHHSGRKTT